MSKGGDDVGEIVSIEDWFIKYEKDITSFLVYYTGTIDVEDLVQDTFLIAMKQMSNFRSESNPKTWLISIARNKIIDQYRRKKLWERIKGILSTEPTSIAPVEAKMILNDDISYLTKAISQLPEKYKEVVILRGILELSPEETATILRSSRNQVNVTYHRSLKKLKDILEREGYRYERA